MMLELITLVALGKIDWLGWLVGLGAGAILVEALRSFVQRKKMGADYADVISASAVRLLAPLEARIKDLESKVLTLESDLNEARKALNHAVEDANHERALRIAAEQMLQRFRDEEGLHYSD
jgi:hypothetical protein